MTVQVTSLFFDKEGIKRACCIALSFLLVTFGQPGVSTLFSILASSFGYALFFYQILSLNAKGRFWAGFSYFFAVQAVQLFWLTSHPFLYIWGVYALIGCLFGLQFGLLSLLCTRKVVLSKGAYLLIPALWTLLEWSRLYWFSGFYFDLAGLSMTANLITLQIASYIGVLGLSFLVMLTNILFLRGWLLKSFFIPLAVFALPFLVGYYHFATHSEAQKEFDRTHPKEVTLIVHAKKSPVALRTEQVLVDNPLRVAFLRWKEILEALSPYRNNKPSLLLVPEGAIPYTSKSLIFPKEEVQALFSNTLGITPAYHEELISSEDIAQAVVDYFGSPLIIGLEGTERVPGRHKKLYFNSAFFFSIEFAPQRYDKQILVPMGEYIPFHWAKSLAAKYDVYDSFTPGKKAILFKNGSHKIGTSVCYEETFGDLMRKYSALGATLLVNLTDDYWYPDSSLALQHFEHALPRTVENGTPLLRACNFGLSGAIDSLGRVIDAREGSPTPSAFEVSVSSYHYPTLYSRFGDLPILLLSSLILICGAISLALKRSS